ncbi:MAG: glycosyltransferase family 2 protein [Thermoguttaceae bacterium]|nr:glycosyltransferase family 2 protein [Thermoguttaceae bacterium]MDW8037814.1 glycosyltransferase family 2 protein [Thermoguttaceae bacterium]
MRPHVLTALPVYNEAAHLEEVLEAVLRYCAEVLVVDDGSIDATPELLSRWKQIYVIRHPHNLGYGAALRTAFQFAIAHKYDTLITIDCDGQHEPHRIPEFIAARSRQIDMVSGSRYLRSFPGDQPAPPDRRRINRIITAQLNRLLGLRITDAFCGFKAYRVEALKELRITETGYAMPLEVWVQAARLGWKIVELPVPRIYLEEKRSFGGALDDPVTRLKVYQQVLRRCLAEYPPRTRWSDLNKGKPDSCPDSSGVPYGSVCMSSRPSCP